IECVAPGTSCGAGREPEGNRGTRRLIGRVVARAKKLRRDRKLQPVLLVAPTGELELLVGKDQRVVNRRPLEINYGLARFGHGPYRQQNREPRGIQPERAERILDSLSLTLSGVERVEIAYRDGMARRTERLSDDCFDTGERIGGPLAGRHERSAL